MSLLSIPELEALHPQTRRRVVNAWLGSGVVLHFLLLALMLLMGCVFLALLTLGMVRPDSAAGAMLILAVVAGLAGGGVLLLWYVIRKSLSDYANDFRASHVDHTCVACGYDLRYSPGGACPECGEWRMGSLGSQRKHGEK